MSYYVKNSVLKDCIARYNLHNLADTLDWIPRFLSKKTRDFNKGEITKEELDNFVDFCARRQQERAKMLSEYDAMTPEQKIKFQDEFDAIKAELSKYFNKITVGIANSMYIHKNYGLNAEECHDIIIDSVISLFSYCTRFDTAKGTSAFSYITQTAKNAIKGFRNEILKEKQIIVTGIDFIDNMEAGSNTQDEMD